MSIDTLQDSKELAAKIAFSYSDDPLVQAALKEFHVFAVDPSTHARLGAAVIVAKGTGPTITAPVAIPMTAYGTQMVELVPIDLQGIEGMTTYAPVYIQEAHGDPAFREAEEAGKTFDRFAKRLRSGSHAFSTSDGPPRAAKFLLLLIPPRNRDGVMGDLEEEFQTILVPEYGHRLARFYFWWHAILACIFSTLGTIGALTQVFRQN